MTATMRFTILGCGASQGSPRVGLGWGVSDPLEPKNRRLRCSLLVENISENGRTQVLVDTGPDVREQLIGQHITHLDGVIYTHEHADHTHGIDELRGYFLNQKKRIPVWVDSSTGGMLMTRFGYCVTQATGSDYPPILDLKNIVSGRLVHSDGAGGVISGLPFDVQHGSIQALGFRVGGVA